MARLCIPALAAEAQSYLTPLFLIPTLPELLLALLPQRPTGWIALVPVYAQQLLMDRLIRGEPIDLPFALAPSTATTGLGLLVAWIAIRIFEGEGVVSGR